MKPELERFLGGSANIMTLHFSFATSLFHLISGKYEFLRQYARI